MPYTLREQEKSEYPVRDVKVHTYDPYHTYFVMRKEGHFLDCILGILKEIENDIYICWLDNSSTAVTKLQRENIFSELLKDYEIIEIDNDEYHDHNGISFHKEVSIHLKTIEDLINFIHIKETQKIIHT